MPVNEASFAGNKLDVEKQKEYLQFALWRLEALRTWERGELFAELKTLAEQMGLKIKDAIAPVFVAIAGSTASFPVVDSMQIIGPDMSRARIRHAINALGGFGKSKQKDLEKIFDKLGTAQEEPAVNS